MEATAPQTLPIAGCAAADLSRETGEPSDDELAAEAMNGSPAALQALADRYRSRLFAFGLATLRNAEDAEDIAQETLVRAFEALPSYRRRGQFRSWIFRIAANLCRDRYRRASSRDLPLETPPAEAAVSSGGSLQEQVVLRTTVFAAVDRLPLLYREPVALHYMEGLSIAETAAVLGRSQTAVRMQLWRARGLLAAALEGWEETR